MNPFLEKPKSLISLLENWKEMYPKAYNKYEVDPYTKTRIILGKDVIAVSIYYILYRKCVCSK